MKETGTRRLGLTAELRDPALADLPAWLDEIAALGLDFCELPMAELPLIVGGRIRRERLAALRAICAGRPFAYTLHGTLAINLMDEAPRIALHLDVLQANLEIAAELGCAHLVIHAGFTRAPDPEPAFERQRRHLAAMAETARGHGVTLCVENIFEHAGRGRTALPSRLAREIALIGHPNLAATCDPAHAALHCAQQGADLMAELAALAPMVRHLHLHDGFGRPEDVWTCTPTEALAFGLGDLHLPMGWGGLPWPASLRASLEIEPRHRAAHAEAAAFARRWIAAMPPG